MADYAMKRDLATSYDDALARLPEALASEGFGVLTRIDVKETLKQKIGADFRRYQILGACNPKLAHRALGVTIELGVMLPCNVVVYENDEGRATVLAIDPMQTIAAQGIEGLRPIAEEVRERLERVLAKLPAAGEARPEVH